MEQQISDSIVLKKSYKIDKQFLVCLDDIFVKFEPSVSIGVVALSNNTKFRFASITELLEEEAKLPGRFEELTITAYFPTERSYSCNEICATFSNSTELAPSPDKIKFDFSDPNAYLVLKNQIEMLLKNHKQGYSLIARIPLLVTLSIVAFVFICAYTNINGIVYPDLVQLLIGFGTFLSFPLSACTPVRKLKRFLYPRNELHIGNNINAYEHAKGWRNIIHVGIVLSFVVGVAVNIVSKFL